MLLERSGETTPERTKGRHQSKKRNWYFLLFLLSISTFIQSLYDPYSSETAQKTSHSSPSNPMFNSGHQNVYSCLIPASCLSLLPFYRPFCFQQLINPMLWHLGSCFGLSGSVKLTPAGHRTRNKVALPSTGRMSPWFWTFSASYTGPNP